MSESETTKRVEELVQVDADTHYDPSTYLSPSRLASIGYQVLYINREYPRSRLLEIGVGSGVAAGFFRQMGCDVSTLDVDAKLSPTILGSVTEIPVEDNAFESFVCCQVLEHLPWEESKKAIKELHRVATLGGVISVPTVRPSVGLRIFPFKKRPRTLTLPGLWPGSRQLHCPGEHSWELGFGVSLKQFQSTLTEAGFCVIEQRQPVENPYHHFFVLEKLKA
jgi:SAM-dependent methyltransferase